MYEIVLEKDGGATIPLGVQKIETEKLPKEI